MGDHTGIEWCDSTWNPTIGCSIVSPGCTNCYAMKMAARIERMGGKGGERYAGLTQPSKAGPVWTGKVRQNEDVIDLPLRWRRPRRIFVNSMSDLFHESLPDKVIDQVFAVMALAPQHTFQVLTKRAQRMHAYLSDEWFGFRMRNAIAGLRPAPVIETTLPLSNVWLGTSVEDQARADERRDHLAAVAEQGWLTWVSYEPALSAVDWRGWEFIRWLVSGGESGRNARPSHPAWHRVARDWCAANGIAYFFKQWGEFLPVGQSLPGLGKVHGATAVKPGRMKLHYAGTPRQQLKHAFAERGVEVMSTPDGRLTFRVGKRAAGRLLDGVEHNGMPTP